MTHPISQPPLKSQADSDAQVWLRGVPCVRCNGHIDKGGAFCVACGQQKMEPENTSAEPRVEEEAVQTVRREWWKQSRR